MKKKFNILCVISIVMGVLGIVVPAVQGMILSTGDKENWNKNAKELSTSFNPKSATSAVQLWPKTFPQLFNDSIYNKRTGEYEPMMLNAVVVNSPKTDKMKFAAHTIGISVLGLLAFVALAVCLFFFFKIVMAVNRGEIFTNKMERWLNVCGILLIVDYVIEWAMLLILYFQNKAIFEFANYNVVVTQMPSLTILLAGMGTLLIAQIFAIGRRMKEEQELTI